MPSLEYAAGAFISLLVLISTALKGCEGSKIVCIVPTNQPSVNNTDCAYTETSLEDAVNGSIDFKAIFIKRNITLIKVLRIKNMTDVEISGRMSTDVVVITCEGSAAAAGLVFVGSRNLTLRSVIIKGCSGEVHKDLLHSSIRDVNTAIRSSLLIVKSNAVHLEDLNFVNSKGTGLSMFNTTGKVVVKNCTFKGSVRERNNEAELIKVGGAHIQLSGEVGTFYEITLCRFENNNSSFNHKAHLVTNFTNNYQDAWMGGGLSVILLEGSDSVEVRLVSCVFDNNTAYGGGGLHMLLVNKVTNSRVLVSETMFKKNQAYQRGGAGAYIESIFPKEQPQTNNTIRIERCTFHENRGTYGGGVAFKSSQSITSLADFNIVFADCNWTSNTARLGSALDINKNPYEMLSSYILPSVVLEDCLFESNIAHKLEATSNKFGIGTLMVTQFKVLIKGTVEFRNNTWTAVYLSSSSIEFCSNSTGMFYRNLGYDGGAVYSFGFSSIVFGDNTEVVFENNQVRKNGGAIYHNSIDKHEETSSRSCFFQYGGNIADSTQRNVKVVFKNNTAQFAYGKPIFVSNLTPCLHFCKTWENRSLREALACIGQFSANAEHSISTSGKKFSVYSKEPLKLIPGKKKLLNTTLKDDMDNEVSAAYFISIIDTSQNISTGSQYAVLPHDTIKIMGSPGESGSLSLLKLGTRPILVKIELEIVDCPPGFIFEKIKRKCSCGRDNFKSIVSCQKSNFTAQLQRGFWMGYINISDNMVLAEGTCPQHYCIYNMIDQNIHFLPNETSKEKLEESLCNNRRGTLCGKCKEGHSVFYHNSDHKCYRDKLCSIGWLFYILSELLPLTLLFVVVIIFDIDFTSGYVTGLIFFAQVIDPLVANASGRVYYSNQINKFIQANRLVYMFFNLDFFNSEHFSFCLWKGATSLQLLVFKFVTVVYAFMLITLTIWLVDKCNIHHKLSFLGVKTKRNAIIHGLSTFLIMVYAQCTKRTFSILDGTKIYLENNTYYKTVVTLDGNMEYFKGEHAPYVALALVCILVLLVLPPLMLLIHPLIFKILHYIGLKETNTIHKIFVFQTSKLKPFLDTFQGCFKDNFRFFAGLYFVYRVLLLGAAVLSDTSTLYNYIQFLLIAIAFVHALAQPYKKRIHNVIDSMLFFNLIVINSLTLYSYSKSKQYNSQKSIKEVHILTSIQVVFISLPLVVVVLLIVLQAVTRLSKKLLIKVKADRARDVLLREMAEEDLPARLLEEEQSSLSTCYTNSEKLDN